MARSARSRSPLRQTRSLFSSLREEQLPPMMYAPDVSTSPRPRRTTTSLRKTNSSRKFGFSKMGEDSMQVEMVGIDLMMEDSNNSVDETIASAGSLEEEPSSKLAPPLSPTGPLSSSAPPGGLTLEKFLKQRRSKDQRRSVSEKTEEKSVADASIQSMDTLRVRAKKASSNTRGRNKLLSKSSKDSKKVISIEEATTNVFLQLCFIGGGSVNVQHHIGLPNAPRDDDIVVMQDTAFVVINATAKALRDPCPVRVGGANSAA